MAPTTDPRELIYHCVIPASDVYGDRLPPPEYEVVDFRVPSAGDTFLSRIGSVLSGQSSVGEPRYILRRKPTVESVYGKPLSELQRLDGFEFTGEFRIAQPGEFTLPILPFAGLPSHWVTPSPSPRLILRKRAPRRRIIFEEAGERLPRTGDWYSDNTWLIRTQYFGKATHDWTADEGPRAIFTRREETF